MTPLTDSFDGRVESLATFGQPHGGRQTQRGRSSLEPVDGIVRDEVEVVEAVYQRFDRRADLVQ